MTDQTRQERIAAAREWCRKVGLIEAHYGMVHLTELMADFSLQVEQAAAKEEAWVSTADRLPRDEEQYLFRTNLGCYATDYARDAQFIRSFYSHWMPIPPYTEPQTGGKDGV
jgi:hypothetical protein